jgi:two-component system copper resistance phosphate regulon response regulator CusR
MRILLVDDDPKYRANVADGLTHSGCSCTTAADGDEAWRLLSSTEESPPDLVLLDVMMPGSSGWALLERMRAAAMDVPVIFVTARDAVEERVHGLGLGADDYVLKPFALSELLARIEAVLRRRKASETLTFDDLRLDPSRRRVGRGEKQVDLSPREFDLLRTLIERQGRTVSRPELLREAWNIDFDPETNVVDVHVRRLRAKLDRFGPELIRTVRGEGYCLGGARGAT